MENRTFSNTPGRHGVGHQERTHNTGTVPLGPWLFYTSSARQLRGGARVGLEATSASLLHPQHPLPGTKAFNQSTSKAIAVENESDDHPCPSPTAPPPVSAWLAILWILGFPNVVWEDSDTLLPKPRKAKSRAAWGHFCPWVSFQKIFGLMERDCGLWAVRGEGLAYFQIFGLAQRFKPLQFPHWMPQFTGIKV